jgi:hypothetical protein
MASSAYAYQATAGAAYEVFLGRRSRQLAERLLDFAAFAVGGAAGVSLQDNYRRLRLPHAERVR